MNQPNSDDKQPRRRKRRRYQNKPRTSGKQGKQLTHNQATPINLDKIHEQTSNPEPKRKQSRQRKHPHTSNTKKQNKIEKNKVSESSNSKSNQKQRRKRRKTSKRSKITATCVICKKNINEISFSLPVNGNGEQNEMKKAHFNCVLKNIRAEKKLGTSDSLIYLGSGCFGIMEGQNVKNKSVPYIKERIQYFGSRIDPNTILQQEIYKGLEDV